FIDKAALTFEAALPYFGNKGVVTGNPVRYEFFEIEPKVRGEVFSILIFGGSQGARAINNAMADALEHLAEYKGKISVVHQTGEADFEKIREIYNRSAFADSDIRPFISDMCAEFANADLVISRAGATTCAELAAAGKASIMIPLPTAADDHQRKNAEAMQKAGATIMLLQQNLDGERLASEIGRLMASPETISQMERSARALARSDAAERTVDLIEELQKNV
ncbi:MAG: UDP-N-acetylglucosamine--N-acetylmuramyl-(pentapeptide) pyrophosphoryl-undecaprenol N-acetylglucosamine transferase, partial [Blastocatellia bacterium]|nr:UDP-N-acetylglucosamine--N-acetylmuramyl-(pentapeptide) pyrophosphoryl-undecaprenol N-acetylglucosamine transferase [Blastocatellia bacterium]